MGNLFVNGNRAIGFGGRTTGGTGTQRSAFRVKVKEPPFVGGGGELNPADIAAWIQSINEERDSWLRFNGTRNVFVTDSKNAGGRHLSRLYLNPADTEVVQHMSSTAPNSWLLDANGAPKTTQEFAIPGQAWFTIKYWERFTTTQRNVVLSKFKPHIRRNDHGTENHAAMNAVGSYLLAQMWPNETDWVANFINGTTTPNAWQTSAQMSTIARANLINLAKAFYSAGQSEDASTVYTTVQLFAWHSLYNGCEELIARSIPQVGGTVQNVAEMKAVAEAVIVLLTTMLAARQHGGIAIAPYQRLGDWQDNLKDGSANTPAFNWLYWRSAMGRAQRDNSLSNVFNGVVHASSWTPSPAIMSIARGETAPYVLTSTCPNFGIWGQPTTSGVDEGFRYPDKSLGYVFRDKLFGIGSGVNNYGPTLALGDAHEGFSIAWKSADRYTEVVAYHEYFRSNDTARQFRGTQSPFTQVAQYKNCAILLLDIPNSDPWQTAAPSTLRDQYYSNLRKDFFVRYPTAVTSEHQQSGWIFLEKVTPEGSIYIAIYTAQPHTIASGTASNFSSELTANPGDLKLVTSNGAKNVAIFDVSSSDYFPSFLAFRTAVLANPPTINIAGTVSATYTTTRGATITATWVAPNYTLNTAKPRLNTVSLKPSVTVTTETAQTITELFQAARGGSDRRFSGRPVMDAPFLNMQNGTSLTLTTPRGTHSVVWNGDVPTITVT
jgi:hypothetical protein